jgi:thiamine pyrophosphate-dependent acetolactate synthase large subunit-like protein
MSGKRAFLELLKQEGVTTMFGNPGLTDPAVDFVGLARSLGVTADRATTVAEATDLLKTALADGGPALIEVRLDRAFKPM